MKRYKSLVGWRKLVVVTGLVTLGFVLPMATAFAEPMPVITPSAIRPAALWAVLCAALLAALSLVAS